MNKLNIICRRNGFSVLELIVSLPAILIVSGAGLGLSFLLMRGGIGAVQGNVASTDLLNAFQHIVRVGRLAKECQKVTSALECTVEFENAGTEYLTTNVRFLVVNLRETSALYYQTRSGNQANEGWNTQVKYSGVSSLEICDRNDMGNPDPLKCPLNLQDGSEVGRLRTFNPNYFRFRISSKDSQPRQLSGVQFFSGRSLVGGFFVRNASYNSMGLVYDWGSGI